MTADTAVTPTPPSTVERLTEIPGIGATGAQIILAEIGLDMTQFPTAAHLVSWAKLCPRTVQSGPIRRGAKTGKGNPYLKGALGEAAAAAAKTNTFLGERYRRLVKRRGKLKALVAVARSILVVVWHLLTDPFARFCDLGPDYKAPRTATPAAWDSALPGTPASWPAPALPTQYTLRPLGSLALTIDLLRCRLPRRVTLMPRNSPSGRSGTLTLRMTGPTSGPCSRSCPI